MNHKIKVAKIISSYINLDIETIYDFIEIPKKEKAGDLAFPCFKLCKFIDKNPNDIAEDLYNNISSNEFERIDKIGPYLNFFIDKSLFAYEIINKILKEGNEYGKIKKMTCKNICIQCLFIEDNCFFRIQDLISIIMGKFLTRIYKSQSYNVIQIGYIGSRDTDKQKSIKYYKTFISNVSFLLENKFDEVYCKKSFDERADNIVNEYELQKYICDEEFVKFISLEKYNMAPYIIWTSNEVNTQRLMWLISFMQINKKYNIHKNIYVGDAFNKYEFEQLSKVIEIINDKKINEGTYVKYVNNNLSKANILNSEYNDIRKKMLDYLKYKQNFTDRDIANIIFTLLIHMMDKKIIIGFDDINSIQYNNFNYIVNTCEKIQENINNFKGTEANWKLLTDKSKFRILKKLDDFTTIIEKSIRDLSPKYLIRYIIEIVSDINEEFFNKSVTISDKSEIELLKAVLQVINNGLYLLGIDYK